MTTDFVRTYRFDERLFLLVGSFPQLVHDVTDVAGIGKRSRSFETYFTSSISRGGDLRNDCCNLQLADRSHLGLDSRRPTFVPTTTLVVVGDNLVNQKLCKRLIMRNA